MGILWLAHFRKNLSMVYLESVKFCPSAGLMPGFWKAAPSLTMLRIKYGPDIA